MSSFFKTISTMLSFQSKVMIFTSTIILIVGITSAVLFIHFYSLAERQKLTDELNVLLDVQSDALAAPLWELDREEVERFLRVMNGNERIAYAGVWTRWKDETRLFAEIGTEITDQYTIAGEANILEFDTLKPVGRLKLVLSGDHTQFAIDSIRLVSLTVGLVLIGISIGVIVLGFSVFTRPLRSLTHVMQRLSTDDIDVDIPELHRSDEIGEMARSISQFKMNAVRIREITSELKQHAERLEISLEREKELNGLQRQFISMVSHEFRTPLAIIDGNAQRLQRRSNQLSQERVDGGLHKVRNAVRRLTELMESVLNASRLEEGKIKLDPIECSISRLLTELGNSYQEIHPNYQIMIDIDRLPDKITADEKLLWQVFSNLISNAIKYSPEAFSVWVVGETDQRTEEVVVSVRDQGLGIPEHELAQLFDRFFRASTSTGIPGSGIGLHLVNNFVGLHGGRVDVSSIVNEGTTFTVRLPLEATATVPADKLICTPGQEVAA